MQPPVKGEQQGGGKLQWCRFAGRAGDMPIQVAQLRGLVQWMRVVPQVADEGCYDHGHQLL